MPVGMLGPVKAQHVAVLLRDHSPGVGPWRITDGGRVFTLHKAVIRQPRLLLPGYRRLTI